MLDGGSGLRIIIQRNTAAVSAGRMAGRTTLATPRRHLSQHRGGCKGSAFADALHGGAEAEVLRGGATTIRCLVRRGPIRLTAGPAATRRTIRQAGRRSTSTCLQGTGSGGDAEGDVLSNIEVVLGSPDDVLTSGPGPTRSMPGRATTRLGRGRGRYARWQGRAAIPLPMPSPPTRSPDARWQRRAGQRCRGRPGSNVEHVIGSLYDDTIAGVGAAEVLEGGAGSDPFGAGRR